MPDLVALDLPAHRIPDATRRVWDRGDAVAVVPRNGPDAWRRSVVDAIAPTEIWATDERTHVPGGRPVDPGDALVMATSGTSGSPKAVVLTHDALDHASFSTNSYLQAGADSTWLACIPLHHIGGFGVVARAIRCDLGVVVHERFDAPSVEASGRHGESTHTSLVATALRRLDASVFRRILVGGSSAPPSLPPNCVTTYGATETCGGIVYDGLPLNGVELRIDGQDQILVRSPTLLRCYRDGSDPRTTDGWYPTGDLGRLDGATGMLHVQGRADDVIVTGGEKVWPEPVENAVRTLDSVSDVVISAREDPEWGHIVVAFVVAQDRRSPPGLDELREVVRDRMPAWCAPRAVEMVDEIPRTALGKIVRSAFRRSAD